MTSQYQLNHQDHSVHCSVVHLCLKVKTHHNKSGASRVGAAQAWHFQMPTDRAGPMGLPLHYRLADLQSSQWGVRSTNSKLVLQKVKGQTVQGQTAQEF